MNDSSDPTAARFGIWAELRPYVDRGEMAEIDALGDHLEADKPIPRAGFRAQLRARLIELRDSAPIRPARFKVMVGAYGAAGILMLAVAALGIAGSGPLAY